MKKIARWTLFVLFTLVLMGCIETITLIHVNKDGSGTIEETIVITNAFTELINSFGGEQAKSEDEPELLDEDELRARAVGMGQGVRLVSAEPIKSDKGSGYKAVFHFDDINKLLAVLDRLVEQGNTVVVIEHNLDVIKCADWIIDLGPEGGDNGGRIVAVGPPEKVAKVKKSYTGQYLKAYLGKDREPKRA